MKVNYKHALMDRDCDEWKWNILRHASIDQKENHIDSNPFLNIWNRKTHDSKTLIPEIQITQALRQLLSLLSSFIYGILANKEATLIISIQSNCGKQCGMISL